MNKACNFNKKIPSLVPFTGKLTKKIVKFYRISQRTEAVIVNVKHKFHLESRIHDNVLLSRVSNEWEHDSLYVSKVKPVNKIHAQSCKRNSSKVKVQP